MNRKIVEDILTDAGAVIAVEKVVASRPGQYDVVLMDVQKPNTDGNEATPKTVR